MEIGTEVELTTGRYKLGEPGSGLNASTDQAVSQIAWRWQCQAKLPGLRRRTMYESRRLGEFQGVGAECGKWR